MSSWSEENLQFAEGPVSLVTYIAKLNDISGIAWGCVFGHLPVPEFGGVASMG
mgnify:CR=1 FL=1